MADISPTTDRHIPVIERIGNYQIIDEIGSGGMAVVYKGIQESLRRPVAIKALRTSVSNDKNIVDCHKFTPAILKDP